MSGYDIFEMLRQTKKAETLVSNFEIKQVLPCFTTPGYIRFIAQADREIGDVIPIIFLKFPPGKSTYIREENTLTLRAFNRMITFHPSGKVAVTNTRDEEEAKEILEEIRKIINDAYKDYLKNGKPKESDIEAAEKLSWTDIYAYLPKTNCGKCGYQVCSAFAASLIQGETKLSKCMPLKEPVNSNNLKALKQTLGAYLLQALGWTE